MSDTQTVENADTLDVDVAAIETEAKALGWSPKENWRGNEADWVDAQTFVERGRQVMPLLKKNNERLTSKLTETEQALASTTAQMKAMQATLKALEEHREADINAQVEERINKLRGDIADASRDGDHARVAELTDELATQRATLAVAAAGKKGEDSGTDDNNSGQQTQQLSPEITQWYADNSIYVTDIKRRALGTAVAMELRKNGDTSTGAVFLEKVKEEVERTLNPASTTSKVSGGNGGSGRQEPAAGGGKSYRDLPKDAKDQCAKYAPRFVGPNKRFKTEAEWQADYAKNYFAQE